MLAPPGRNTARAVVATLGGCASTVDPVVLAGGAMHICAVEDDSFAAADSGCKDLATGLVWSTFGMGNGPPSGRYCCGNGVVEGPEGDGRCDGNP